MLASILLTVLIVLLILSLPGFNLHQFGNNASYIVLVLLAIFALLYLTGHLR